MLDLGLWTDDRLTIASRVEFTGSTRKIPNEIKDVYGSREVYTHSPDDSLRPEGHDAPSGHSNRI
jgi:hypothetical protein